MTLDEAKETYQDRSKLRSIVYNYLGNRHNIMYVFKHEQICYKLNQEGQSLPCDLVLYAINCINHYHLCLAENGVLAALNSYLQLK